MKEIKFNVDWLDCFERFAAEPVFVKTKFACREPRMSDFEVTEDLPATVEKYSDRPVFYILFDWLEIIREGDSDPFALFESIVSSGSILVVEHRVQPFEEIVSSACDDSLRQACLKALGDNVSEYEDVLVFGNRPVFYGDMLERAYNVGLELFVKHGNSRQRIGEDLEELGGKFIKLAKKVKNIGNITDEQSWNKIRIPLEASLDCKLNEIADDVKYAHVATSYYK